METEAVIKTYTNAKHPIFCQHRMRMIPLEIKLGCHVILKINEIICKLCKTEDEIHFVCVCPALEPICIKHFNILNINESEVLIDL